MSGDINSDELFALRDVKLITEKGEEVVMTPFTFELSEKLYATPELKVQSEIWNPNTENALEFESKFEVDDNTRAYFLGYDRALQPSQSSILMTYYKRVIVQARRHKKKRINKKWLKRYGYKTIYVRDEMKLDDCNVTFIEDDSVEFTGSYRGRC